MSDRDKIIGAAADAIGAHSVHGWGDQCLDGDWDGSGFFENHRAAAVLAAVEPLIREQIAAAVRAEQRSHVEQTHNLIWNKAIEHAAQIARGERDE